MWTKLELEERIATVAAWLRKKAGEAGARGLVCGISGGVDSAVVAGLCKKAFPDHSLGVIMPCHSEPEDREDALLTSQVLGIPVIEIDLGFIHSLLYEQVENALEEEILPEENNRLGQGNLKARLRMSVLYTVANLKNYLVVGTDNAAESYTGYFTKYGDGGVDVLPISSLTKTEVREWARVLGLPEEIASRVPTAGLWADQTDEKEMGISYDWVDRYLIGEAVPPEAVRIIESLHKKSRHKREVPPGIDLPKLERLD